MYTANPQQIKGSGVWVARCYCCCYWLLLYITETVVNDKISRMIN